MNLLLIIIRNISMKLATSGTLGIIVAVIIFMLPGGLFYLLWRHKRKLAASERAKTGKRFIR